MGSCIALVFSTISKLPGLIRRTSSRRPRLHRRGDPPPGAGRSCYAPSLVPSLGPCGLRSLSRTPPNDAAYAPHVRPTHDHNASLRSRKALEVAQSASPTRKVMGCVNQQPHNINFVMLSIGYARTPGYMEQASPGSASDRGRLIHGRRAGPGRSPQPGSARGNPSQERIRSRRRRLWGTASENDARPGAGRPRGPRLHCSGRVFCVASLVAHGPPPGN